jgi:glycosyltransferase involved in cell wall biosynthesis
LVDLNIDFEHDFNFLTVAQWGPRKNLENTVKWFMDEFRDKEVGLIIKTSVAKNCLLDRRMTFNNLRRLIDEDENRKCKVYLLHGYMSDQEINSLYNHPKVKCLLSATHGEGFGLPIFEAAYNGLPIVAPAWSGHVDFLDKDNSLLIGGELHPVHKSVANKFLMAESSWFKPDDSQAANGLKQMYKKYKDFERGAKRLRTKNKKEFSFDSMVTLLGELFDKYVPEFPKQVELSLPTFELPKLTKNDG